MGQGAKEGPETLPRNLIHSMHVGEAEDMDAGQVCPRGHRNQPCLLLSCRTVSHLFPFLARDSSGIGDDQIPALPYLRKKRDNEMGRHGRRLTAGSRRVDAAMAGPASFSQPTGQVSRAKPPSLAQFTALHTGISLLSLPAGQRRPCRRGPRPGSERQGTRLRNATTTTPGAAFQ